MENCVDDGRRYPNHGDFTEPLRAERVEAAIGLSDDIDLGASDVAATGMTYSAFKKIRHRAYAQDSDPPRGYARAQHSAAAYPAGGVKVSFTPALDRPRVSARSV